jgi:hypothetical protein
VLDVDDAQAVLERLVGAAVGDAARVSVRVVETEPDRQLADKIEWPVRKNARAGGRGCTGHGVGF